MLKFKNVKIFIFLIKVIVNHTLFILINYFWGDNCKLKPFNNSIGCRTKFSFLKFTFTNNKKKLFKQSFLNKNKNFLIQKRSYQKNQAPSAWFLFNLYIKPGMLLILSYIFLLYIILFNYWIITTYLSLLLLNWFISYNILLILLNWEEYEDWQGKDLDWFQYHYHNWREERNSWKYYKDWEDYTTNYYYYKKHILTKYWSNKWNYLLNQYKIYYNFNYYKSIEKHLVPPRAWIDFLVGIFFISMFFNCILLFIILDRYNVFMIDYDMTSYITKKFLSYLSYYNIITITNVNKLTINLNGFVTLLYIIQLFSFISIILASYYVNIINIASYYFILTIIVINNYLLQREVIYVFAYIWGWTIVYLLFFKLTANFLSFLYYWTLISIYYCLVIFLLYLILKIYANFFYFQFQDVFSIRFLRLSINFFFLIKSSILIFTIVVVMVLTASYFIYFYQLYEANCIFIQIYELL